MVLGSSANPGLRDFAVVAALLRGLQTHRDVSFDVNPSSRQTLQEMTKLGATLELIAAGARLHQSGCMGCIGMGQAPTVGGISLRTVPCNFPGRSGTVDDCVYLCSPETAAAMITGHITDLRDLRRLLGIEYPCLELLTDSSVNTAMLEHPPEPDSGPVKLVKGPNISSLPSFGPLPDRIEAPVGLKVGDQVSTDDILLAGARVLPYRSNIPTLADFTFGALDDTYSTRMKVTRDGTGHIVAAGSNYGQGSSREHAAITPRYLGLRSVLAVSFAGIHWQNLTNFGVLALEFADPGDHEKIAAGDVLILDDIRSALRSGSPEFNVRNATRDQHYHVRHRLSDRQIAIVLAGGLLPWLRARQQTVTPDRATHLAPAPDAARPAIATRAAIRPAGWPGPVRSAEPSSAATHQ